MCRSSAVQGCRVLFGSPRPGLPLSSGQVRPGWSRAPRARLRQWVSGLVSSYVSLPVLSGVLMRPTRAGVLEGDVEGKPGLAELLPGRLVVGNRLHGIPFEPRQVLREGAVRPLPGSGLAVDLLVGQSDERADESRPLGEPFGDEPLHRRCGDPGLVAPLEDLARMDLLVIDVVRQQGPD